MPKRKRLQDKESISYREVKRRVAKLDHIKAKSFTYQDVEIITDTFIGQLIESLVDYEEVHIPRFGYLYRNVRTGRRVLDPRTKEELWIKPHYEVRFRIARYFRQKLGFFRSNDKDFERKKIQPRSEDSPTTEEDLPTDL